MNLLIAVTLQGFNDVQGQDSCRITDEQLFKFVKIWADLDTEGTGYIHISEVGKFFKNLISMKCEIFPSKVRNVIYEPDQLTEFIEHL